ncbi:hypothetical protein E6O75_ATG07962 [Venturia nashicola]|uniref:Uncharacterized protein n=1 Tax=Venturia nashicola TaxID=86259 RepID=A0A4Z1NWC2_9PEZI|nr:hypothetical protein E6O75_ATG07962 [Venturia nashicola]
MASRPPFSPFGQAFTNQTTSANTDSIDPALEEPGPLGHNFEGDQYALYGSQHNETMNGSEGTWDFTMTQEQWYNILGEQLAAGQSIAYNSQPIEGNDIFNQTVDEVASQSYDADPFSPIASQQQWDGQQGSLFPANYSQGNWENHGSQIYDNFQQLLQSQYGYDHRLPAGSYRDMPYDSQQTVFTPQYHVVNDQGQFGGHGRQDSGYNVLQQQYVPQTSSANINRYAEPQVGAQHAIHSQQAMAAGVNGMHQQFRQPSWDEYQQPRTNEYRPVSPIVAPQPQRSLSDSVENDTDAHTLDHDGRPHTSAGNFNSYQDSPVQNERQPHAMVPQRRVNHPQQAAMPLFNDLAPQSYQDGLQQLRQGSLDTIKSQASDSRLSRESTVENQSVPPQVTIPPDCPIGNLTDYSLDFVRPPQKVIKKAVDDHWIDYPGPVQEFFTSPFPEYCLTPENPNNFLPPAIHIKTLSPAQMLEYHARAPQHRDLMHQFVVPRITGYPNELPGDTPAIKQKKFKNNTISMRQQRLREQNGQFMGDAKIARVAKKEKHKSLTKVFMEVLPKMNGASLLHGTIGQIMQTTDGRWFTRTSFTGGGLNGDHDFPLRQPMAIPRPLAEELKKAGLPEPDLHEHLRQNEEIWRLFYPQHYNNGRQLPPIEENRRQTKFVKGRGRKTAVPGQARGTKRQRTVEPATQQTSDFSSSVQASAMPLPQHQRTFENLQSPGTQQFFANIHSLRNHQRIGHQAGTQLSHPSSVIQHGEDDHNDRVKKRRTGPAEYDVRKESSTMDPATTNRGSFVQHLNGQRGNVSTPAKKHAQANRRRQQIRTQQHGQVAQIVNPGWNHIVGTAISDERARQAQVEATLTSHDLRPEASVDVPSQQEQSPVDDEQWAGFSSSPFKEAGVFQKESANLASSAADESSSFMGPLELYSSPIRYDLMAMPRVPIGGVQWQDEYAGPPVAHDVVDLTAANEVRHLPSSSPATGRAEVNLLDESEIPQIPSSPLEFGLNDSGYFPGGSTEGNDDGSQPFPQAQEDGFEFDPHDVDLSQVSDFNISHNQAENPEQASPSYTEASVLMPEYQDDESDSFDLTQVSQFNAYSQGEFAQIPEVQTQAPEIFGDGHDLQALTEPTLTQEYQSQPESPVVQSDRPQLQNQEDDQIALPPRSANISTTKEPIFIDLAEEEPETSQPNTSNTDDLAAEDWDFPNKDDEESSAEEEPPRQPSWSQLNDHASAHRAQSGEDFFESCEQCLQHGRMMDAWGAEKTKKKVKGEAIGYGTMTEETKMELHDKMMRQAGLPKKIRNREIYQGL